MKAIKSHSSELVLLLMMVLLLAASRIYYGGQPGCMIVWKGELTFADTLVDLEEMVKLPPQELLAKHRTVFFQLEDMGMLDDAEDQQIEKMRRKFKKRSFESGDNSKKPDTQTEGGAVPPGETASAPASGQTTPASGETAPASGETASPAMNSETDNAQTESPSKSEH